MATLTATATETATVTAMAIAMATATATATMTKGGLPLHVPAMCSAVGGATPCLHPHGHKKKCIPQCCVMGVRWQLTRDCFFVYFLQLLFGLLNNPLFVPRDIQVLKNPVGPLMLYLLHSSKNLVSLLTIHAGSYCTFYQGKPGQGLQ